MLSADFTTGGRLVWRGVGNGRSHRGVEEVRPLLLPGSLLGRGRPREKVVSWRRGIIGIMSLELRLRAVNVMSNEKEG